MRPAPFRNRDMVDRVRPSTTVANRVALENGRTFGWSAGSIWPVILPRAELAGDDTGLGLHAGRMDGEAIDTARLELAGPARLEMAAPTGWLVAPAILSPSLIVARAATTKSSSRCSSITRWPSGAPSETSDGPGWPATKERNRRIEQNLDRIRLARTSRDDTMQRAGLEEDLASARSYLGEARRASIRPMGGVPEPSEPDRIRLFGRPTSMIGIMPGIEETRAEVPLILERPQWDADAEFTAFSVGGRDF